MSVNGTVQMEATCGGDREKIYNWVSPLYWSLRHVILTAPYSFCNNKSSSFPEKWWSFAVLRMPRDKKGCEKRKIQNCFTPRSWGARSWREEPDDYALPKEHAEHRNSGLCGYTSHAILANLKVVVQKTPNRGDNVEKNKGSKVRWKQ